MAIEFECSQCSKLLRVSDESRGKKCKCPVCETVLSIPESPQANPAQTEETSAKGSMIDVACPACKQILHCDRKLLGTRGHCAGCGTVFTIALHSDEALIATESMAFACPQCKKLFEGHPSSIGRKAKCSDCQNVFVIERYIPDVSKKLADQSSQTPASNPTPKQDRPAPPPAQAPVPASLLKTRPKSPAPIAQPTAAPPSRPTSNFNLDSLLPPPAIPTASDFLKSSPYAAPVSPKPRRKKSNSGSNSGLKWVLGILGSLFALSVLLCCGGVFMFTAFLNADRVIVAEGYQATASGIKADPSLRPNQVSESVLNPTTRSEFAILTVWRDGDAPFDANLYLERFRSTRAVTSESSINRLGMDGVHYEFSGAMGIPAHVAEVYSIENQRVLILMYINGRDRPDNPRTTRSMSYEESLKRDNCDKFFASLRRR